MKNFKELTLNEKALLEVLVDYYGYNEEELLENEAELLESLKDDYLVLNDKEADDEAYSQLNDLIDDIGLNSFNVNLEDYISNQDFFEDAFRESYEMYASDVENESSSSDEFENRLEEEMYERGVENMEDFVQSLLDDIPNFIDEFRAQYGEDCFNDVIVNNNLIEIEELISDIIDMDGRGHIISGYDGMEHEVCIDGEDLYIYRTN